jgi:deoxyribonuclease V
MTDAKPHALHSWEVTPTEAVALQKQMRDRVLIQPLPETVRLVAGADISYNRFSDVVYAAIVVLRLPELSVAGTAGVVTTMNFPYIPGLLSFREAPPLLEAWEKLELRPEVLMLDGQGTAHPRRFGIACHLGLLLDLPTIGCGKTLLTGKYDEPAAEAGSYSPLIHKEEVVGAAVRTRSRVNPVYVSPGHLADLPSAIDLTLRCVKGYAATQESQLTLEGKAVAAKGSKYRLPEPTRLAHQLSNAMRRGEPWQPPEK